MADSRIHRLPITIPDPGDPDRKRALNVLAQRRYRQRRREKIQGLERRLRSNAATSHPPPPPVVALPSTGHHGVDALGLGISVTSWSDDFFNQDLISSTSQFQFAAPPVVDISASELVDLDSLVRPEEFHLNTPPQDATTTSYLPSNLFSSFFTPISLNGGQQPQSQSQLQSQSHPQTIPISAELQSLETSQFTFPDDSLLDVPVLTVLRAGFSIAETLGCAQSIWDLSTLRTFSPSQIPSYSPSPSSSTSPSPSTSTSTSTSSTSTLYEPSTSLLTLPRNLLPTNAQQKIPHHALFDILPWPAVRTRLICVFAQPAHLRPPSARSPDAVMRMLWDLDDEAEGMRVSGDDCFDERNWEVGQLVFSNWWWAFDRQVVENSNSLRRKRGVARLAIAASDGGGGAGGDAS